MSKLVIEDEITMSEEPKMQDFGLQVDLMLSSKMSIERLENDPQLIQYYTGFDNFDHFMLLFNVLGPNIYCINLNDCGLTAPNQLFLTMLKLRQAKDDYEIGVL